jgi:hypothetical protein
MHFYPIGKAEETAGDLSALVAPQVLTDLKSVADAICIIAGAKAKRAPADVAVAERPSCANVAAEERQGRLAREFNQRLADLMNSAEGAAQEGALVAAELTTEEALGGLVILSAVLVALYSAYLGGSGSAPTSNVIHLPKASVDMAYKSYTGSACPKGDSKVGAGQSVYF